MRAIILSTLLLILCLPTLWGQTWQYTWHRPSSDDVFYAKGNEDGYAQTLEEFVYIYKLDTINPIVQLTLTPQRDGFAKVSGTPVFKDIFGDHLIRIDSQGIRYKLSDTATQSYTFINGVAAFRQRTQAKKRLKELQKTPKNSLTKPQKRELAYLLMQQYDYYDLAKNHRVNLPDDYYRSQVREVEFVGKQPIKWCGGTTEVYIFYLRKDTHSRLFYYLGFVPNQGIVWIGASISYGTVAFFERQCSEDNK